MKRYGPRLMTESAPGAAATRNAPFGNDRRLHRFRPTAITWRAITGSEAANRLPVAASTAIALITTMSGAGDVIIAAACVGYRLIVAWLRALVGLVALLLLVGRVRDCPGDRLVRVGRDPGAFDRAPRGTRVGKFGLRAGAR